jgi:hypothetical protein
MFVYLWVQVSRWSVGECDGVVSLKSCNGRRKMKDIVLWDFIFSEDR